MNIDFAHISTGKEYLRQVVRQTLNDLLLRFVLVPFNFVKNAIWSSYNFMNSNTQYIGMTYHGLVLDPIIAHYKKFGIFILFAIPAIVFQSLTHWGIEKDLFTLLNQRYFPSLPTIQENIGRFVNVKICYKIIAKSLLVALFIGAWWVWRIELTQEVSI